MKIQNYKITNLLKFLMILLFVSSTGLGQITFVDSNFEKGIRQKVEWGWIWVPNYTGSNYQFTEEDFTNVYYLSFESCLLYTSPSPRDATLSRMPSSA